MMFDKGWIVVLLSKKTLNLDKICGLRILG